MLFQLEILFGTLSFVGDRDWVGIRLTAGFSYLFNLTGSPSGAVLDDLFRLYDPSGSLLTFDDDGGEGNESRISYTATTTEHII